MLREIRCNKFHQRAIQFHNGLNVVLGAEDALNSIGKSTALLAIDFALGGNSYVSDDLKENVGDHIVEFSFQFGNDIYYFSRSTDNIEMVNKCDSSYRPVEIWKKEQYAQWLKEKYGCGNTSISFREIVSLYSRIYGKGNATENKPLNIVSEETKSKAIRRLLGVFEVLDDLEALEQAKIEAETKVKVMSDAASEEVIVVHKSKKSKQEIEERLQLIDQEIMGIQSQISSGRCSLTEEQLQVVSDMYEEREQFNAHLMRREARLRRLNRSEDDLRKEYEVNIEELREFFPAVNMQQLENVNNFHHQLSDILAAEVKTQIRDTECAIRTLKEQIADIDKKISAVLEATDENATQMALKRLMDRAAEQERLKIEYQYAQDFEKWKSKKKQTKETFEARQEELLRSVESRLNRTMEAYSRNINPRKNPPQLELTSNNYTFECENDKGTGTRYAGVIILDLSVLQLTMLPILIHDNVLFKNIEDSTISKLVSFYQGFPDKQIFISMDKVSHYDRETSRVLQNAAVLQLGRGESALFGSQWNENGLSLFEV